jgi:glycosyltransferase involved in cell wall biosynthesis
MPQQPNIKLTIITPCFNEVESIVNCISIVRQFMQDQLADYSYEHILIDNASTDGTVREIKIEAESDKRIKLMINSRNIGASRSVYRALIASSGEAIIPMLAADLQDPVEVIAEFVSLWESGSLVVFGQRTNRQENFLMRILRGIYYRIIRKLSQSDIPINAGEFMLIDRKIANSIIELHDTNPYIRGMVGQTGVPSKYVQYTWVKRTKGKSKSTPFVLIDFAINGLVSTSRLPARIVLLVGFAISGLGILMGIATFVSVLFLKNNVAQGIPTLIVAVFILGGIQLFFLGLIGEYVLSIHGQVRQEPGAFDIEKINFN